MSATISEGIVTGKNDVFLLNEETVKTMNLENEVVKPCVRGKQLRKYFIEDVTEYVIYPYESIAGRTKALPSSKMRANYPNTWRYFQSRRKNLAGRRYFENSRKEWYELWNQRNVSELRKNKILVPELAETNRFALADKHLFYGDTVCGITIKETVREDILYILGLLNSRLVGYLYKQMTVPKANQFYIWKTMFLKNIPIRTIRFSDSREKAMHYLIVTLVDYVMYLKRQLNKSITSYPRDHVMAKYFEQIIDGLVYELYLSDELYRGNKRFFEPLLNEDLPRLKEISDDKTSGLRGISERLFDKNHPVRKNLFFLDSLETIRMIEGKT